MWVPAVCLSRLSLFHRPMASGFEILLKILECAMCGFNFLVERVKLSLWDPNFLRNFRLLLRHPNFRKKRRESLARAKTCPEGTVLAMELPLFSIELWNVNSESKRYFVLIVHAQTLFQQENAPCLLNVNIVPKHVENMLNTTCAHRRGETVSFQSISMKNALWLDVWCELRPYPRSLDEFWWEGRRGDPHDHRLFCWL